MAAKTEEIPSDDVGDIPRGQTERPLSGKHRRGSVPRTDRSGGTSTPGDLHIDLDGLELETANTEIIETDHPRYERPKSSKGRQRGERMYDTQRYGNASSSGQQQVGEQPDQSSNIQPHNEEIAEDEHDPVSLTSSNEYDDHELEKKTSLKKVERPTSSKVRQRVELTRDDLLEGGATNRQHASHDVVDPHDAMPHEDQPPQTQHSRVERRMSGLERPKSGWDSNLRRRRVAVGTNDADDDLDIDLEIIAFHSNDYVSDCKVIDFGNSSKSSFGGLPAKLETPRWNSKISPFTPRAWNVNSDHPTTTKALGHFGEGGRDEGRWESIERETTFSLIDNRKMNGDESSSEGSSSGRSDGEQMIPRINKPATFSVYEYEEVRGKVLEKYRRSSVLPGQALPSVHSDSRSNSNQRRSQPPINTIIGGRTQYSSQPPIEISRRGPVRLRKLEPTCRVTKHSLDKTIKPPFKHNGLKSTQSLEDIKSGHKLRPLVGKPLVGRRAKAFISGNDPQESIASREKLAPVIHEKPKIDLTVSLKSGVTDRIRHREVSRSQNMNSLVPGSLSKGVGRPPAYAPSEQNSVYLSRNNSDDSSELGNDSVYVGVDNERVNNNFATPANDTMTARHQRRSSLGNNSSYLELQSRADQKSQLERNLWGVKVNNVAGKTVGMPISEMDEFEHYAASLENEETRRKPPPEEQKVEAPSSLNYSQKDNIFQEEYLRIHYDDVNSRVANQNNDTSAAQTRVGPNQNRRSESTPHYNETILEERDHLNDLIPKVSEPQKSQPLLAAPHLEANELDRNDWTSYGSPPQDPRHGGGSTGNARPWGQQSLADLWQETQKMC